MFRVLFLKELREIWWIGVPVLLVLLYGVSLEIEFGARPDGEGYGFLRYTELDRYHPAPLIGGTFARLILLWGGMFSGVLGLWQTFRETQSRTWHFLLYRPVNRNVLLWAKVLAASALFAVVVLLPAVGVMLWAATPFAHASPFRWSLTAPVWYALAACPAAYFAALFAGLRRSHLAGTRWWPLLGSVCAFGLLPNMVPNVFAIWVWALLLIWISLLIAAVRDELCAADFS
ncbi:MAG: family transporter protein [Planctomycetaceae bacterium]|nr:family transporter protein [Planctomycetaceae bacterium]